MSSLPPIDFGAIASTAKQALAAYGTEVQFFESGSAVGRPVKAVIYRETNIGQPVFQDVDGSDAVAILNPDDFSSPNRMPQKFDQLRVSISGFVRTYTLASDPAPILASSTLPLLLVRLRAN